MFNQPMALPKRRSPKRPAFGYNAHHIDCTAYSKSNTGNILYPHRVKAAPVQSTHYLPDAKRTMRHHLLQKITYTILAGTLTGLLTSCALGANATPFIAPTAPQQSTIVPTALSLWTSTPDSAALTGTEVVPSEENTQEVPVEPISIPSTEAEPSATPTCTTNLKYLADLTIPDGEIVAGGTQIDKQWQVQNEGTCNWDSRYRLKLVGGFPPLGAEPEQALFPARAGSTATIQILFIAPVEPGVYRSAWQAYDPDGNPFGDTVYIEIIVQ